MSTRVSTSSVAHRIKLSITEINVSRVVALIFVIMLSYKPSNARALEIQTLSFN
jgi:hypothetical protein